jgi:integrase
VKKELSDQFAATVAPTGRIERYFDQNDKAPRGFLLRVTPASARAWALQYREHSSGRQREITIGDVRSWSMTQARKRGHELRREIDAGGDPLADREKKRQVPTVDELWNDFIRQQLPKRASRTQAEYRAMYRDWIGPALGRSKIAAVKRSDIEKLHRKITAEGKERRANSVKSLVSTLFAEAVNRELCANNPAKGIESNVEHVRERYLEPEELERLIGVLERWREKRSDSVDAIMLLVLTGARRAEVLSMAWAQVDLKAGIWIKPSQSTKQGKRTGKSHRVRLSDDAAALLQRRKDDSHAAGKVVQLKDDFVFRGGGSKTHTNTLERDWYQIRAAAALEDLRIHDLRHSFASFLVGAGQGLPIVGAMLGHAKAQTTQRYAHLADKPAREAAEIVAKIVRPRKVDGE